MSQVQDKILDYAIVKIIIQASGYKTINFMRCKYAYIATLISKYFNVKYQTV